MRILIVKDSATKISRECTLEQAQEVAASGLPVVVIVGNDHNGDVTQPLADWVAENTKPVTFKGVPVGFEAVHVPKPAAKKPAKKAK